MRTLFDVAAQEFPGEENEQRRRQLQTAIKSVIISSEAGLGGDQEVLSPGQLKHWVEAKIKDIHESIDGTVHGDEAPSKKRKIAPIAHFVTNKRPKRITSDEQDVVAALLNLACPPIPTLTLPARRIAKGRKIYTAFPAVDRSKGPKHTFLAGVEYALKNFAAGQRDASQHHTFSDVDFREYVKAELGIKGADESETRKNPARQVASKSFWNVI
jgi:hypothetical protein